MNKHEIYPGAPVVAVTVEVRHAETDPITASQRRQMKDLLRDWAPIQRSSKELNVPIIPGSSQIDASSFEEFPKFFSRDSTLAISFRQNSFVVEATQYTGWRGYKMIFAAAVESRVLAGTPDSVERIGIRFINEVRTPVAKTGDLGPIDWSEWLNPELISGSTLAPPVGLPVSQWRGLVNFGPASGRGLILQYGPGEGVIEFGGELMRSKSTNGPFFWIDIDSYWIRQETIPEFDKDFITRTSKDLHTPARSLFEQIVTDRFREEVLRASL